MNDNTNSNLNKNNNPNQCLANRVNPEGDTLHDVLQKIYYDPSQGLHSQEKFYQKVKNIIPSITRRQIGNILKTKKYFSNIKKQTLNTKVIFQFITMAIDHLAGFKLI